MMLHRTLIPIAVLAVFGCSAQNTRPPEEPVATTTITRAALTTSNPSYGGVTPSREAREAPFFEPTTPLAVKYRAALMKNPALENVSLEHIQVEQSNGHVTLRGWMLTVADKVEVELAIRQMKGVTSVTNDIQVIH